MLAIMTMIDKKPPVFVPDDDITDAELEAIAEGMLKDVLAREDEASKKLDIERIRAIEDAGKYFAANRLH